MKRDSIRLILPTVFLAAFALLVPAGAVRAQSVAEPNTWTVTPFLHTSLGVGDPAPGNSLGLGAAVAYDWTANLGFEGEFSHLFDVAGSTPNIDWGITNFSANVVYHFDVLHVTPYATFGLGVERSTFSQTSPDPLALALGFDPTSTEIAINFGGGAKYRVNDRFLLRADLRRFQANDIAPDYWRLYGGVTVVLGRR